MIEAGQIYFLRKAVGIGRANYGRPCLVLCVSKLDATICYFSTKMEYRKPHEVAVRPSDSEYLTTGLRDSSYILNSPTDDVDLDYFKGAKLLGRATGDFKKRIEEWYGAPLG
jgi:hypothetical protein